MIGGLQARNKTETPSHVVSLIAWKSVLSMPLPAARRFYFEVTKSILIIETIEGYPCIVLTD